MIVAYLSLITIAMLWFGSFNGHGIAAAAIPNSLSASTSGPHGPGGGTILSPSTVAPELANAKGNWMIIPFGCKIMPPYPPRISVIFHPAACSGANRTLANHSLSGVDGNAVSVPRTSLNCDSLAVRSFCCSCVSNRGAMRCSILTRASRSASACAFRPAASFSSSAVRSWARAVSPCSCTNSFLRRRFHVAAIGQRSMLKRPRSPLQYRRPLAPRSSPFPSRGVTTPGAIADFW